MKLFEQLAVRDIQDAADILRPVYEKTRRADGYVSLEVSPFLAHDTVATVEEARRLWQSVARPNLMIKVPGTPEGIPAFEQLIGEGINVNVTLLFAQEVYQQVALAYLSGLETLAGRGGDAGGIASVASFFVSRIDTSVDSILKSRSEHAPPSEQNVLRGLLGKTAIANAKLAYRLYQEVFSGPRWQALQSKGARAQRLLWASTSTKDPAYRDVLYVEELIGRDTVNTIPPATFDAFREHGRARPSLEEDLDSAWETMAALERLGISMKEVTDDLTREGVRLFAEAFDKLLNAVDRRCPPARNAKVSRQTDCLPAELASQVKAALDDWQKNSKVRRRWMRDATLWTGDDEARWLDWLELPETQRQNTGELRAIAEEAKSGGFTHAMVLGMGGSSLCPEVLAKTFGKIAGFPALHVLDSTDPAQVSAFERKLDLSRTLFIVSSKSGTTLEPNVFLQYFYERMKQTAGAEKAGRHFIAITDPGSKLEQTAERDGFRKIFYGLPGVGGRYSALSAFGMAPAAVMGLDAAKILDRAAGMAVACSACLPAAENPGVTLGAVLGVLGRNGRDKVTLIVSPKIRDLGAWLEQLVAESTGKSGTALIPVDREPIGPPEVYGSDRLFVYIRLDSDPDATQDAEVESLIQAHHPVVRIGVAEPYDLGQEFFRWEMATAVAGSILGIHPFNQPDVEASKVASRKLTDEYETSGSLPPETPVWEGGGIRLFADPANAETLGSQRKGGMSLAAWLRAHLGRLQAGDYFALLAYIEMNDANEAVFQEIRRAVRNRKRVATCLGFGPRFLHSTGQAYKGGPNTGVFLQITADDAADVPVPGQKYTFSVVKAAQARGDFQVLSERKRRALRVHLSSDVPTGLAALDAAVQEALAGS
jgi:transaldolase/glucose-6-phosphate isomerase